MNIKLKALQDWLNLAGASPRLVADGLKGPATRAAILQVFVNKQAPKVTQAELEGFARRLGGTLRQIRAVAEVESAGGGFFNTGRPKILWERHYFLRRLRIIIPGLSNPKPGGYSSDANHNGINDSWERMADAMMIDPGKALESASWGKFQVMGAWWKQLGYRSSISFAWSMRETEAAHYEVLVRYIRAFGLDYAFRKIDGDPANCTAFARGYNGKAQQGYDSRIAEAWRRLA